MIKHYAPLEKCTEVIRTAGARYQSSIICNIKTMAYVTFTSMFTCVFTSVLVWFAHQLKDKLSA